MLWREETNHPYSVCLSLLPSWQWAHGMQIPGEQPWPMPASNFKHGQLDTFKKNQPHKVSYTQRDAQSRNRNFIVSMQTRGNIKDLFNVHRMWTHKIESFHSKINISIINLTISKPIYCMYYAWLLDYFHSWVSRYWNWNVCCSDTLKSA